MRPHHFLTIIATLIWFTLPSAELLAELKLPSFFSNQMVLQRDKPVSYLGVGGCQYTSRRRIQWKYGFYKIHRRRKLENHTCPR